MKHSVHILFSAIALCATIAFCIRPEFSAEQYTVVMGGLLFSSLITAMVQSNNQAPPRRTQKKMPYEEYGGPMLWKSETTYTPVETEDALNKKPPPTLH